MEEFFRGAIAGFSLGIVTTLFFFWWHLLREEKKLKMGSCTYCSGKNKLR